MVRPSGAPSHSRHPSSSNADLQAARNEVTRTLEAVQKAQEQLVRLNQDLAQYIKDFARDNNMERSAELDFLRYDHQELVHANLRKAQTEHEGAKERLRSLELAGYQVERAKRGEQSGSSSTP